MNVVLLFILFIQKEYKSFRKRYPICGEPIVDGVNIRARGLSITGFELHGGGGGKGEE